MSMYLPNPDIRPTGSEPGEFIEVPPMAEGHTSGLVENHDGDPEEGSVAPEGVDAPGDADIAVRLPGSDSFLQGAPGAREHPSQSPGECPTERG